jgi:Putative 8-oxoguanine DNA glycosylase OGG-like protein
MGTNSRVTKTKDDKVKAPTGRGVNDNGTASLLKENAERIRHLRDKSFEWGKEYDRFQVYPIVRELYHRFPNRTLCRDDIVKLVRDNELLLSLIAAMIWGGISTGSTGGMTGDNFTKMLKMGDKRLEEIAREANRYIANGEIREAFVFLEANRKISGVGHAYHTKILFFIGQANPHILYQPLIFDKWMKNAFCVFLHQTGQSGLANEFYQGFAHETAEIKPWKLPNAYEEYVKSMNAWARHLSVKPSKLEEFVFGDDRRTNKQKNNPRVELLSILSGIYNG